MPTTTLAGTTLTNVAAAQEKICTGATEPCKLEDWQICARELLANLLWFGCQEAGKVYDAAIERPSTRLEGRVTMCQPASLRDPDRRVTKTVVMVVEHRNYHRVHMLEAVQPGRSARWTW